MVGPRRPYWLYFDSQSSAITGESTVATDKTVNKCKRKIDGCSVWNAHNTVFGCNRSAICAQAVYFLHSTMPSVTCLRLSDVISSLSHLLFLKNSCQTQLCTKFMHIPGIQGGATKVVPTVTSQKHNLTKQLHEIGIWMSQESDVCKILASYCSVKSLKCLDDSHDTGRKQCKHACRGFGLRSLNSL